MGIDSNALLYGDLEVGQWEVELGEGITISQAAALEVNILTKNMLCQERSQLY